MADECSSTNTTSNTTTKTTGSGNGGGGNQQAEAAAADSEESSTAAANNDDKKKTNKWACAYCTYLNWDASAKCVLCYQPKNRPMLIEELYPTADDILEAGGSSSSGYGGGGIFPDEATFAAGGANEDLLVRWPCPACTYMNCRRTKRCIQCATERPGQYVTPPCSGSSPKSSSNTSSGDHSLAVGQPPQQAIGGGGAVQPVQQQQQLQESQLLMSRALNKWSCLTCTYDNWPTAQKCTICGQARQPPPREQSRSPPQHQQRGGAGRKRKPSLSHYQSSSSSSSSSSPFEKKLKILGPEGETPRLHRLDRQESGGGAGTGLERLDQLSIAGAGGQQHKSDYTSALDIYVRRFLANDPVEKLFFKAAVAVGHRELQMVNRVVDYLINEGNLQRALNAFESRLLNQYIARSGHGRVVGFERADSLFFLSKKSDCMDLMKLIRRVRPDEDRLPCGLNCAARTCLYAKVTAQCMATREGPPGQFKCQFIAHPYNFNLLNMPMPGGSELGLAVQNALFRPAPSIPPRLCYLDCFDAMASQGGMLVGRPPNFLMRNRGGPHSLYDSVFQCMFGVCDRFNILRAATKYTMHRSAHLFKIRWLDTQLRMIRDCGLSVSANELDADWEDIVNSVGEEDECPEPIHIWVLAHVCCRPIIVCSMDDPVDIDQLLLAGAGHRQSGARGSDIGGRSPSPRGSTAQPTAAEHSSLEIMVENLQQYLDKPGLPQSGQQQQHAHSYQGIYLPLLWAAAGSVHHQPTPPISRSPLLLCYRNGLFHACIVSDFLYQRDAEVQRYVRLRRCLRRPGNGGAGGDSGMFRFLARGELDNSALLAQFLLFGQCNAQQLSIRREPHSHMAESLHFYKHWMQAMVQLSVDQQIACGTAPAGLLETRMDEIAMGGGGGGHQQGGNKKTGTRKGSPPLHQQNQYQMAALFAPIVGQQLQLQGRQQQQLLTHPGPVGAGVGRSSPPSSTTIAESQQSQQKNNDPPETGLDGGDDDKKEEKK